MRRANLTQRVVDFVRAGVQQIFREKDARATKSTLRRSAK